MPYNIPANSICEFSIRGFIDGQATITTFHYQNLATQADGKGALIEGFTDFEAFVVEFYRPLASLEWQDLFMQAQWIWPTRYQPITKEPATTAGGVNTPSCPSGVAIVTRRKGDTANRKSQGRVYWPGIPFASITDSKLLDAWMDANADAVANTVMAYLNLGDASQLEPVIWSRANAGDPVVVTSSSVDNVLRYQRRRELRVGI